MEAGYITTSGHRLLTATDTNLTPPTKTPEYLFYDTTGARLQQAYVRVDRAQRHQLLAPLPDR